MIAIPLDELLESWRYAREGVIAELANIPADSWSFRPTPPQRSVAELAQHILDSGRMMSGELSRTDGDFTRQDHPAFMREYGVADPPDHKSALIELLRTSHQEGDAALRAAGEAVLSSPITQFGDHPSARGTCSSNPGNT